MNQQALTVTQQAIGRIAPIDSQYIAEHGVIPQGDYSDHCHPPLCLTEFNDWLGYNRRHSDFVQRLTTILDISIVKTDFHYIPIDRVSVSKHTPFFHRAECCFFKSRNSSIGLLLSLTPRLGFSVLANMKIIILRRLKSTTVSSHAP